MDDLAKLIRVKQSTQEKLSSQQDFSILNELLIRALLPIIAETQIYHEWLAEIISHLILLKRGNNDTLLYACFEGLHGENVVRQIVESGIDRELIFKFLNKAIKLGQQLEEAQIEQAKRRADRVNFANLQTIYDVKMQLGNSSSTAMALRTSSYWYELALKHKESILDHYMRLLLKTASRTSHASGNRIEIENAFSEAYIAASQAVDRFCSERGVLASYISSYLKGSSRVSATQALGLAAPGSRVASSEALQTDPIDDDMEIFDETPYFSNEDSDLIKKIDVISNDLDVRAVLMLSGIVPPFIRNACKQ
jgi:hypothetical protein